MRIVRALFVLLGLLAVLIAVVALAAETASFIESGTLFAKPLGQLWREQHLLSLQLLQVGVERKLGLDWLWQRALFPLLLQPPIATAGVFAALGALLLAVARAFRRRRWPAEPRRFTST